MSKATFNWRVVSTATAERMTSLSVMTHPGQITLMTSYFAGNARLLPPMAGDGLKEHQDALKQARKGARG